MVLGAPFRSDDAPLMGSMTVTSNSFTRLSTFRAMWSTRSMSTAGSSIRSAMSVAWRCTCG